jgi:hypothetical protein
MQSCTAGECDNGIPDLPCLRAQLISLLSYENNVLVELLAVANQMLAVSAYFLGMFPQV